MLSSTHGIILHTTNYSESSLIVKVFTKDRGLQSFIVSGVRGKKSKNKANLFQPLSIVEIVFVENNRSNLHRISELNSLKPYTEIPFNIIKSSIVLFLNEVVYKSIKEEHPDQDLYEYISNSLLILDLRQENCANFHVYFMIQLTKFLGFYPQGEYSEITPLFDLQEGRFTSSVPSHSLFLSARYSTIFYELLNAGYNTIQNIKMEKEDRKQLLQALVLFYQIHIQGFGAIKSLDVLEEILA